MLTEPFYHGTIRRYIVAFGTIFNNIRIRRFLEDGSVRQNIPIPLTFSPKQRWWSTMRADGVLGNPGGGGEISRFVPNSAFNLVSMTYDAERKLNTLQKTVPMKENREAEAKWQYQRVPYTFGFELYTVFKQYDDSLQYIEQVLPYFTPYFNIPTIDIPELNILNDSTLTLGSIQPEIIYEGPGSSSDSRTIMYTFSFTLKGYIYPPTKSGDVVEKVITNTFAWPQGRTIDELGTTDESDNFGFRDITHMPELTLSNIQGTFRPHENIFVGSALKYHSKLGTFISIDENIMQIVTGNKFEKGDIIRGSISGASATVEDFNVEVEREYEYRRNE